MRSVEFYAVIAPTKRWYKSPRLTRTLSTRHSPALKPGEVAVRVKLELPDDWNVPYNVACVISENQIQRPIAKAV